MTFTDIYGRGSCAIALVLKKRDISAAWSASRPQTVQFLILRLGALFDYPPRMYGQLLIVPCGIPFFNGG